MRKKMMLLALALTAAASALSAPRAEAGTYSCPICTYYSDGSKCCIPCWCNGTGQIVACTDLYCPPEGGDL